MYNSSYQKTLMRGVPRVIVHLNNTDVVVYLLYCIHYFIYPDIKDLWIKLGIRDKSIHIPDTSSQIGGCFWYSTLQSYFKISCRNWL